MQKHLLVTNALVIAGTLSLLSAEGLNSKFFEICCGLVVIVSALTHALCAFKGVDSAPWRRLNHLVGCVVATLGAGTTTLFTYFDIMSDGNSTAAIGLLFLPVIFILQLPFFYYIGWTIGFVKELATRRSNGSRAAAACYVLLAMVCVYSCYVEFNQTRKQNDLIDQIARMDTAELTATLHDGKNQHERWILNALVSNPALSQDDLFYVANLQDPMLHERGRPSIVSNAGNTKGLAVMRLVAMHPNVGAESLEVLSRSKDEYVRSSVIANLKTPDEIVEQLVSAAGDQFMKKSGLQQRLRLKAERAKKGLEKESAAAKEMRLLPPLDPDKAFRLSGKRSSSDPSKSGCSKGARAALLDLQQYPNIAACAAHWPMASMRARKTGKPCGGVQGCNVPADACSAGWHVCGDSSNGADELRASLNAELCAGLAPGRFIAGLSDSVCDGCGTGGGRGAVCCGTRCVQQNASCVWPHKTAWAGITNGHINACGEVEISAYEQGGVLCCRDGATTTRSP